MPVQRAIPVQVHLPVTVADTASVDATLVGQHLTLVVLPAGVAHQSLSGAGTNTHAQIDTALSTSAAHIASLTAHGVFTSRLAANQTLTTTTQTSINNSGFNIGASETWLFEAFFITFCSGSSLGMKFAPNVTVTPTSLLAAFTGDTSAAGTYGMDKITANGGVTPKVFTAFGTVNGAMRINGTVINGGTAGVFYYTFASNNASCTALLEAGSYMTATRIA